MKPLTMLAAACLLLAACQESPVAPEAPELEESLDLSLSKKGGGPSAGGAAQTAVLGPDKGTFSFHVRAISPDVTFGTFQVQDRALDIALRGRLNCIRVEGSRATVSGFITAAGDNPFGIAPGWLVIFGVEDNGEGKKAPPDRWTDVLVTPIGVHCSFTELREERWDDGEGGRFQVRP